MSKVTAKYQITIPMDVRKELGIVPGSEVDITKEEDKYILLVNPINELKKKWRGRFKNGITSKDYMDEIRGKVPPLCPDVSGQGDKIN
ncbi:MAG: AbrB/MazE/SpoVT family DNA-binding domain-containing protein [Thermodesulfovibrionia bacterium]